MKYIFLHGLGQKSSDWESTVKAMNNNSDVLCPDLTQWLNNTEPSYFNLYRALEKYCEQFNEPLNLCGLSLGGILAVNYTIEHSENVNSLVLIGTQISMPKKMLKFQNLIFKIMPDSAFHKMGFGKHTMINLCRTMMDLDFSSDLKNIKCPVLVICGEKDRANKSASLQIKKEISNSEISIISDAGHEVNLDAPLVLGEKLNKFFSACNLLR